MILKPITPAAFDRFVAAHPSGNWLQTSQMANFRTTLGWSSHLLGGFEDGTLVAVALLAGKAGRYEITMGPLLDLKQSTRVNDFFSSLHDFVQQQGGYVLEVYPQSIYTLRDSSGKVTDGPHVAHVEPFTKAGLKHKGFTTDYDPTANRWVYVKSLEGITTEQALLASYRQTTRQIIRKIDPARYSIKKLGYDQLEVLKTLIDSSNDKNHIPGRPLSYYQSLYTSFGNDVEMLVAYYDTTPLSGAVFIHHPRETVYFLSGTDSTHRQLYGAHYLQHHAMLQAIKAGQQRYNFYGISGHFNHNPLLIYKAGFRGYIEEYVGGFVKIINARQYRVAQLKSKAGALKRKLTK